jgi:MSHA biogenesis protein MshK
VAKTWLFTLLVFTSLSAWASQDPTAPLGWQQPNQATATPKVATKPLPRLQSIVCSEVGKCRAILSGKVVLPGESVSGYRVNRIEPEVVTLSRSGKQWKLELFTLDVKQ